LHSQKPIVVQQFEIEEGRSAVLPIWRREKMKKTMIFLVVCPAMALPFAAFAQ
jgi:hypothetical protein